MSEDSFGRVTLASVTTAIKDGTHGTHARAGDGVPFLSAKNITDSGTVSWDEADDCISESEYEQIHRNFRLQPRDLLLTIVGSLGRRAVFDGSKVTFQRSVAYVRPDTQRVSERFLFHWFAHGEFQQELVRRSNSTAQAGLYLGELAQTLVPDSPFAEQVKIAEILDTLDSTIRKTEAIIEKLKQVKQGLLHDLLTRGIDANGELRPPQCQAPHLYKDSPLGWIPREWDVVTLAEVSMNVGDGVHYAVERSSAGVPFLFVSCVRNGGIDWSSASFTSRKTYLEISKRSRPQRGMILFTAVGSYGHAAHIDDDLDFGFERNIAFVVPNSKIVCSKFLFHFLLSAPTQIQVDRLVIGNAQKVLTLTALNSLLTIRPALEEQQRISAVVDSTADRISKEVDAGEKLKQLKSGLMDDLLTGRVRVTSLLA